MLESNELELRCATKAKCNDTKTGKLFFRVQFHVCSNHIIRCIISKFELSILDKRMNYKKVTCCETDNCNGARSSPNLFGGMHGNQGMVSTIQTIIFSSCFAIMFSQANILQGRFSLATNDVF